jgi:ADP-L-glycero-D-manno-heptose 6-epimerase
MIWQLSRQMLTGKRPRIFKHGEQFRDFIYVKDVVAANLKAMEAGTSGVFNVCTGKKTTFNKIIEVLNKELSADLSADYFDNPYAFYQDQTLGDPAAAERALGFKAKHSIEEGIREYMQIMGSTGTSGKEGHAVAA